MDSDSEERLRELMALPEEEQRAIVEKFRRFAYDLTHPPRPWCCPEPRCAPVHNDQVKPSGEATPGDSFICFGRMERSVTFVYDGVEHENNLNHCDYTPLKGLIRWQENPDDWRYIIRRYQMALAVIEPPKPKDQP